jgi:hypothetical protein
MEEVWLTTAYLGTYEYFRILSSAPVARLEACESYEKQSWRNRSRILAANGPLDLSIPVIRGSSPRQPVKDVRIDHGTNWQKTHYRSVESAYRHAPYWEFLIDDLRPIWEKQSRYLFDYNLEVIRTILGILRSDTQVVETDEYREPGFYGAGDFRYVLHPKHQKKDTGFAPVPYHQVFIDRYGFVGDLSIIDWLFNSFRT